MAERLTIFGVSLLGYTSTKKGGKAKFSAPVTQDLVPPERRRGRAVGHASFIHAHEGTQVNMSDEDDDQEGPLFAQESPEGDEPVVAEGPGLTHAEKKKQRKAESEKKLRLMPNPPESVSAEELEEIIHEDEIAAEVVNR